ncbi:HdeD family acid-resistance protein [Cellulomonas soli]|uniref:HdeD family acid-resistance protein n=1 Tax=Cellulomonas soli TaxID=931535 RepID=UPI003F8754BE
MTLPVLERRRTGWDVILGILIVIAGFVVLGDVIVATKVSVLLLAWTSLFSGIVLLVGSLFRIRSGGAWSAAIGGAVLSVLGVFMLRNPVIGAVTLTLLAGALFLAGGLARLVAAFQSPTHKVILTISGIISIALGVYVLINPAAATLVLLGVLLGVQILIEGLTLITLGRLRVAKPDAA